MSDADAPWGNTFGTDVSGALKSLPRISNYQRLLGAAAAGNLADGIFKFTLPVLAVSLTANKILISSVTAGMTLPWLFASLPAGALADRADRLKMMIQANTFRTAILALFAVGLALKANNIWLVLTVALSLGLAEVIFDSNSQAMIPNVVGPDMLGRANARLMTLEFSMNQFIGKALGGWLAGFALWAAFGVAAGAYFVAAIALMGIVGKFQPPQSLAVRTLRAEMREGLAYMWKHKLLRNLALLLAVMEFFYEGVLAILPIFALAKRNGPLGLSAPEYGLLIASMAIGGLVGSLIAHRIEARFNPIKAMAISAVTLLVQIWALAFTKNVWLIGVGTILVGGGSLVFSVLSVTLRQRLIPDAFRGRVNAIYRLAVFGSMSIGAIGGGIIAEATSVRTFFVVALVMVAVVVAALPLLITPYNRAVTAGTNT